MSQPASNSDSHAPLRKNIRILGDLLGETIRDQDGEQIFTLIEQIRALSKASSAGDSDAYSQLDQLLTSLQQDQLIPVVRSFGLMLNLMNIAEEYHRVRRLRTASRQNNPGGHRKSLPQLLTHLGDQGISKSRISETIENLNIELVLTAHPTEVSRRTVSQKYDRIADSLDILDTLDSDRLSDYQINRVKDELRREIASLWATDEIRHTKPTPVDEATWGITTIEQTLWSTVPTLLRQLDFNLKEQLGEGLSIEASPISFASWMGGDRDGNPNVTAETTDQVCWLSRWQAAELLQRDIGQLRAELSISSCSDALRDVVGEHPEPYRHLLRAVRDRLILTRDCLKQRLDGDSAIDDEAIYSDVGDLKEPLMLCYDSLISQGMATIASGRLTDIIRRVNCFGLNLTPLDIRQESSRHSEVLDAVTRYIGVGEYLNWSESEKLAFLTTELKQQRPLIPTAFLNQTLDSAWLETFHQQVAYPIENVYEVLKTCQTISKHPRSSFANYIISMAHSGSDVLAVMLLQREAGVNNPLPVMPLFETLQDLEDAPAVIENLFNIDGYVDSIDKRQQIMIGYSDSAKDAGFLTASWAQYRAQEKLVEICQNHDVQLRLFHGRGGSMSRGGGSAHDALLSQPPGAVEGYVRITEQGEMIRFKFGLPGIAYRTLELYTCATLEATLLPPPKPSVQWREQMDRLTASSLDSYRNGISNPGFLEYFHDATPEQELQRLSLGSRPAKRKASGGIESLRAIPWVFAWTQTRLLIPAWLGSDSALETAINNGDLELIQKMSNEWPYFASIIDMLEMVLAKAKPEVSEYYEQRLVGKSMQQVGAQLRARLAVVIESVNAVRGCETLLEGSPVIKNSIKVRNPYMMPLHFLQAEIMGRLRAAAEHDDSSKQIYEQVLKISITSIAAGMRNTG
ncbi:MAG: phosphoenolpyruvate carboxylase [Pseudomonadales bacterium]|nr:phosphoenolpyruvate carboxylase [Pseudomonadales bacterium]